MAWNEIKANIVSTIEGYHSSYLEGLRIGDYRRSRHAVEMTGHYLRLPDVRRDPDLAIWREEQKIRWTAYSTALGALEERSKAESNQTRFQWDPPEDKELPA